MPGLFGAIGVPGSILDALEREVLVRWPEASVERSSDGLLAAHAFNDIRPILRVGEGRLMALDGEWSLYREVQPESLESLSRASRIQRGFLDPDIKSTGNIALLSATEGSVHLAVDLTGTFPLYFTSFSGGLIFSSLLRPIANLISACRNDQAVLEFLRQAYTVGGKTVFEGVYRLLPGQSLSFRVGNDAKIQCRSDAWAGSTGLSAGSVAEEAWQRLLSSMNRGIPESGGALMMSGGWDSRTLLAGIKSLPKNIHCYSHGDVKSRELAIVRELCSMVGVTYSLESIDARVLERSLLREGFLRTENVVFPHWHRAGKLLSQQGIQAVSAGVFGEILGGHYGPAMLLSPAGKVTSIGATLLGLKASGWFGKKRSARDFLRIGNLGPHWYLKSEYEAEIEFAKDRMNADIESAITRLEARGINNDVTLVEAFISEHRGAQRINAQLLSCRAYTDISLPFGGGEIFAFSTWTSLDEKVHNRLNRQMLKVQAPHLLKPSMAATLVPAGWPLLVQEASRMGRKIYEDARLAAYQVSDGRIPRPNLGWVNFDFLATATPLYDLIDELQCDFWDRESMRAAVTNTIRQKHINRYHPIYDQFTKIVTVDRLLT